MTRYKDIAKLGSSPMVNMGPLRLRQPIPTQEIENVDPFLLLHHYGPYAISAFNNPFDLGPHPHRGFEPITLLFKGEQFHRDSLGNEMIVKAGDVQWTTAGRGIIHAEAPSKEFVEHSGDLEGIQLWLNLPKAKKMIPPNYQHLKKKEIPSVFNEDQSVEMKIVAGNLKGTKGKAEIQSDVNIYMIHAHQAGTFEFDIPENHQGALYLLNGVVIINESHDLVYKQNQLAIFSDQGERIKMESKKPGDLLFVSGVPFNEPVVQYGPYVMNTQTEILEAMRDFQQGKMGYLY